MRLANVIHLQGEGGMEGLANDIRREKRREERCIEGEERKTHEKLISEIYKKLR